MSVYSAIASHNATVNDVQQAVVWTLIATIVTYALLLSPYVFWIKSYFSIFRKLSQYNKSYLNGDLVIMWIVYLCMLSIYIASWGGYLAVMAQYKPMLSQPAPYGITAGQETWWLVLASLMMANFTSLIIYRSLVVAGKGNDGSPSITESDSDKVLTKDPQSKPLISKTNQYYWEKVDVIRKGYSYFFRLFMPLLICFAFMIFLFVYPLSVNGEFIPVSTFYVTGALHLTTGIILTCCLLFSLWYQKKDGSSYETYISRLLNNTDVVTHSYANSFYGFTLTGHILAIELDPFFIGSFVLFFYNCIYIMTCSIEKANTFEFSIPLVSLVASLMSQKRSTFFPFLFAALFFNSNVIYLIEFSNPPETNSTIGQSSIDFNYPTTAPNCSLAKMTPDVPMVFGVSIAAFVISIGSILSVCMHSRKTFNSKQVAELKTDKA